MKFPENEKVVLLKTSSTRRCNQVSWSTIRDYFVSRAIFVLEAF